MSKPETVLQASLRELAKWDGVGTPPARPVFHSLEHKISALVSPFANIRDTIVVLPHAAEPGSEAHMVELDPLILLKMTLVYRSIGRKMLSVKKGDQRVIEHTEGFAVADHPHMVLFPAIREQGKLIYERGLPVPTEEQLDETWVKLSLNECETTHLLNQLDTLDIIGPLVNNTYPLSHHTDVPRTVV